MEINRDYSHHSENDELRLQELKDRLKRAGCDTEIGGTIGKGFVFPKEYDDIAIEYISTFESDHLNSYLLHVITKNKKYHLIPIFLEQFYKHNIDDSYRWTLGDCLYIIGYKDEYFDDYMDIAGTPDFGFSRQMVVWLLGKSKRLETCELLLHLMKNLDLEVILHTLAALKYFKDEIVFDEVKVFADHLISPDGKIEYSEKAFKVYSPQYTCFNFEKKDAQQCYRALLKDANKILARHNAEIKKDDMILYPK